jgi:hypothetical protein
VGEAQRVVTYPLKACPTHGYSLPRYRPAQGVPVPTAILGKKAWMPTSLLDDTGDGAVCPNDPSLVLPGGSFSEASGNLYLMTTYTLQHKMEFVRAWRSSGKSQEAFCREHPAGVASRTLRSWARAVRRPDDALATARTVVAEAADKLAALLASIEAGIDGQQADAVVAPATPPSPAAAVCRVAEVARSEPSSTPGGVSNHQGVEPSVGLQAQARMPRKKSYFSDCE